MKRLSIFLTLLLGFALLLFGGLVLWGVLFQEKEETQVVRSAREQAKLAEISRTDTLGNFFTIFWICLFSLLLLGLAALIFVLIYKALHAAKLKEIAALAEAATLIPSPEGNYPARLLSDGSLVTTAPGNLKVAVPYHYSPSLHTVYQLKGERDNPLPQTPVAQLPEYVPPPLPGHTDLGQVLENFTPSPSRILLGLGAEGKLITVSATELCHVALGGRTGGGKDMITRLLVGQLLSAGAHVFLADPHYTPIDPVTGEDWRMIEPRLMQLPARKPGDIAALLQAFVEELDLRLEKRFQGEKWGAPMFFVANEIPAIHGKVDLHQLMTRILKEGRKVQMLMITSSQDWLVKSTGLDTGARRQLNTRYYLGGDEYTGRALLELPRKEFESLSLGKGLALLRSAATPTPTVTRVPFASNESLYRLLPPVKMVEESEATIHKRVEILEQKDAFKGVQTPSEVRSGVQKSVQTEEFELNGKTPKTPDPERTDVAFGAVERAGTEGERFKLSKLQPEIIRKLRERGMGKQAIIETLTPYTKGGSQGYRAASARYDELTGG